jgi:LmbE family N-acetylglucosaminyl deacetylase
MEYVDFRFLERSDSLSLIFKGWEEGEAVAFLSPHDDDVLLGAGGLLRAVQEEGGSPHVIIFSRGDAGYSHPDEKDSIVEQRKKEALKAYGALGLSGDGIRFLALPDFSVMPHVSRIHPQSEGRGIFDELVGFFRSRRISRVVFSSAHLENWDHTAVNYIGVYVAPQAGDAVLAELGQSFSLRSYITYAVWGDFAPRPGGGDIRADFGILSSEEDEERILGALSEFTSQRAIIADIIARRESRRSEGGFLELYQDARLRKPIDYSPYLSLLKECKRLE